MTVNPTSRGFTEQPRCLTPNGDAALKPHLGLSRLADSVQQLIEQRQIGDRHVGHAEKIPRVSSRACQGRRCKLADVVVWPAAKELRPSIDHAADGVCEAAPGRCGSSLVVSDELVEHAGKPVRVVEVRKVPRSLEDHDAAVRHRLLCRDGVP